MNNTERRTLEIYLTLLIQKIRKNNSEAITDIKHFIYGVHFMKNYDPEFLFNTCIENLEILEKIPTRVELLLTLTPNNNSLISITPKLYKALGIKTLTRTEKRIIKFSLYNATLHPKIKNKVFHEHLLTFLTNYAIISTHLPIKINKKELKWKL